jgi:hypothetical protein
MHLMSCSLVYEHPKESVIYWLTAKNVNYVCYR